MQNYNKNVCVPVHIHVYVNYICLFQLKSAAAISDVNKGYMIYLGCVTVNTLLCYI